MKRGEWVSVGDKVERNIPKSYPTDVRYGTVVEVIKAHDNKGVERDAVRVVLDRNAHGEVNPFTGKKEVAKPTTYLRSEVKVVKHA